MNETKSLFDTLYEGAEELLKGLQKPLVKRQVKRKFAASHDSLEKAKNDAEIKLQDLRKNLKDYKVDNVVEQLEIVKDAAAKQLIIQEEYKTLFGKEMPKVEDED